MISMDLTMKRLGAAALVLAVVTGLGLQFYLNGFKPGLEPWGMRAWDLMRFFTILTNSLVAVVMAREALNKPVGKNWLATATLNIALVGIIFQILLAPPEPLAGLAWLPDFLFHAGVPVGVLIWWLVWGRVDLRLADIPRWLIWPVAYCLYILVRASSDGNYVYFFLDVETFGASAIARNICGLVLVFAAFGALMVLVTKRLSR